MRWQIAAVRASSHTIALCNGRPVRRSHSSVVSRWFVTPTAITRAGVPAVSAASSALAMQLVTLAQISSGSCSVHLGAQPAMYRNRSFNAVASLMHQNDLIDVSVLQ